MVDGATSEWIPIVSGIQQGSVLGTLLFILYAKCLSWLRTDYNYTNADDSTAVVREPADRPAVDASFNRDMASIQEWLIKVKLLDITGA